MRRQPEAVELRLHRAGLQLRDARLGVSRRRESEDSAWDKTMRRVRAEWDLMKTFTKATTGAVIRKEDDAANAQAVNEGP